MTAAATAAQAPVLAVRGLSVSYATRDAALSALRDVSFTVDAGETLALVGESGSGKSTVALAIMGLLGPEAAIRGGRIAFRERDLATLPAREREALRGDQNSIVFQDPFTSLNPALPIGLQVAEPLVFHRGMPEAAALEKAIEALAEVGLPRPRELARAYPHQLSGGMQQRALIATALICDPALVILDEPTTALDVTVEAEILDLLDALRRKRGLALLFITHNLGLVNRICDAVCVLYAGSVLELGPTAEVLRRPAHPYTRGLLSSMPRLDLARRRSRLAPIPGKFPDLTDPPPGCVFHPRCGQAEQRCGEGAQLLTGAGPAHEVRCWKAQAIAALPPVPATAASPQAARTADGAALVELRDLAKAYALPVRLARPQPAPPGAARSRFAWPRLDRPEVRAVAGVSLAIRPGETLGLVGESGCGKSTLGRCVVRLLEPTGGAIVFDGRDVSHAPQRALRPFRQAVQIVFQNPVSSLNPRKTVGAAIARSIANFAGLAPDAALRRRDEILEQVGLSAAYAGRYPHQLSGGERQRVGIARALAAGPRFIVCDEPVSALDVSVQATVLNLLADLRDRLRLAYLFISHDLSVVVHIADRIAVMYGGVICEEGPTDAVLAPPYHPYTEVLLSAIPSPDPGGEQNARIRPAAATGAMERPTTGCCFQHRCARRIGPVCADTSPPWIDAGGGHRIACHLPLAELRAMAPVLGGAAAAARMSAR